MDRSDLLRRAENRLGRLLKGKWRLDALLGVGGTAAVYAATHRNGKRVAIKILHPGKAASENSVRRFLREGYAANLIEHPGVSTVLDDDVDEDGAPFLIRELVDGITLEDQRRKMGGKLPIAAALSVGDRLLEVLAAAHERGIIHRDIKPANLLVSHTGELKVVDFGAARLTEELSSATSDTDDGAVPGTPAYMSPEQARGALDEVDTRTDIWAVGATLYVLISGRLVHEGKNVCEVMGYALSSAPPPLASVASDVPPAVALLIDRALSYDKARRFQSATEMRTELLSVLAGLESKRTAPADQSGNFTSSTITQEDSLPQKARSVKRPIARSSKLLRIAGAVGIGLGAAMAAWLLQASSESPHVATAHARSLALAAKTSAIEARTGSLHAPARLSNAGPDAHDPSPNEASRAALAPDTARELGQRPAHGPSARVRRLEPSLPPTPNATRAADEARTQPSAPPNVAAWRAPLDRRR